MSKEKNTETVTSDSGNIRIEMNTGQRISLAMFLSQLYQNVNIQKHRRTQNTYIAQAVHTPAAG